MQMCVGVLEPVVGGGLGRFRFRPLGVFPTALPSSVTRSVRSARLGLLAAKRGGTIATPAHSTKGAAAAAVAQGRGPPSVPIQAHLHSNRLSYSPQNHHSRTPTFILHHLSALQMSPAAHRVIQILAPAHTVTAAASVAPIATITAAAVATPR